MPRATSIPFIVGSPLSKSLKGRGLDAGLPLGLWLLGLGNGSERLKVGELLDCDANELTPLPEVYRPHFRRKV